MTASTGTATAAPWVIRPSSLTSPDGGPRRVPPRPRALQEPGYLDAYDGETVFYDVFRCGRRVLAVGPPAGSLEPVVRSARVVSSSGGSTRLVPERALDRLGRFWARAPREPGELSVVTSLSASPLPVSHDLAPAFAGRRAVMTLSKDNDLEWIADWGRWYAERHSADALVVYDNGSTRYTPDELWSVLSAVPGIEVAAVVVWPFPYGPIGRYPAMLFDSNYAQHGALEHARWRLLRSARGFLNADIDELVGEHEQRSVFDAASAAPSGAAGLEGVWVYPDPATPLDRRPRHADAFWVKYKPPDAASPPKWCVDPTRLARGAQLTVHTVRGVREDRSAAFRFWHLLSISTDWTGGRRAFHVDPANYRIDEELHRRHEGARLAAPSRPGLPGRAARLRFLPSRARSAARRTERRLAALASRIRSSRVRSPREGVRP